MRTALEKKHRFHISHLRSYSALTVNRLFGLIAETSIGIFFPIFIYSLFGNRIEMVYLWWMITYGTRLPLFVLGARFFSKYGLVFSMIIGSCSWILYYYLASLLHIDSPYVLYIAAGTIITVNIQHMLYWAPFHVEFAQSVDQNHRGKKVSTFQALQHLISLCAPIIAGYLIATFSYSLVFMLALIAVIASMIPLFSLPHTSVEYEFGFIESWKELFTPERKGVTYSMIADGVTGAVGYLVWPVFLYIVFEGDVLNVGIYSSIIVLISIVMQLALGNYFDALAKKGKSTMLKIGDDLYAFGWVIKAVVDTLGGVFVASTYHRFTSILLRTPYDTLMYEQAADAGHYIDEYTVLREMALTIGRFSTAAVLFITAPYVPIQFAFILAAFAALGIRFIIKKTD